MRNIKELSREELSGVLASWKEPSFRAGQVMDWVFRKGASGFSAMTDIPAGLREKLEKEFSFLSLSLAAAQESADGTRKLLFKLGDGKFIEAVSIPADNRLTGCVSSQAGCKFACKFCASGMLGFKRDLSSAEILDEVLYLKNNSSLPLTHIVFMGTGEPLDNYDNVMKAVRIINSPGGFNIGARRITISTCGLVPGIEKLAGEGLQIELSVSLHAADDRTRDALMPVNKRYPVKELIAACRKYNEKTNRQVTFEYILAAGVNSDLSSARRLCKMVTGLDCKFNLIPVNPRKETGLEAPLKQDAVAFREALAKAGIPVTIRRPRGQDIEAACGQLRLRYEKK